MRQHHNVLYVTTEGAWVHKRDAAVEVCREGHSPVRIPRHHLHAIVCFGPVKLSPWLVAACAEEGISIAMLSSRGRFLARVVGPTTGNVLLRRAQYRCSEAPQALAVAKGFVLGKIANYRTLLRRAARESTRDEANGALSTAASRMTSWLEAVRRAETLDALRGQEGIATKEWFDCFPLLLRGDECFSWSGRSRRPPRDLVNSLLGFLYALLVSDCSSAAESVGLDPQVGFLHADRPGRPALALDLMEELRPVLVDRAVFTLVNRRQLGEKHFETQASGAVYLTEAGRKSVLTAWQVRKREEIRHGFLDQLTTWSLVPHLQARLLARFLRGDLDAYPPFLLR